MWQATLISAGLGFLSARRQRQQARRQAEQDRLYQQEQNEILEKQKQEYRDIVFTNPYADMQNPFADMQNPYEDLTVNQQQAQFQAQQGAQQRADIMQRFQGAAGGSGIAGLAQALANQGQLQAQQISASIGQQEAQRQTLMARGAAEIQKLQGLQESRMQMAERGGEAMLQQAEMSRQATLLGMQMGQASGANQQMQQSLYNQQQANVSAGQMMAGAFGNLATGLMGAYDSGIFDRNNSNLTGGFGANQPYPQYFGTGDLLYNYQQVSPSTLLNTEEYPNIYNESKK